MSSLPKLGQSRAMLRRDVFAYMLHLANPSALDMYLGERTELFMDCNLLEADPEGGRIFPLYLGRQDRVARLFSGHELPHRIWRNFWEFHN